MKKAKRSLRALLLVIFFSMILLLWMVPVRAKADDEYCALTIQTDDPDHGSAMGRVQIVGNASSLTNASYTDTTVLRSEDVTVEAIPNPGYRFVCWINDSSQAVGEAGSYRYTFTVYEDVTYTAVFAPTSTRPAATLPDIVFEEKNEGYTAISTVEDPRWPGMGFTTTRYLINETISLTNTGTIPIGVYRFVLSGRDADKFRIHKRVGSMLTEEDFVSITYISPGQTTESFQITPVNGLSVGVYEATLVLEECGDAGFDPALTASVRFVVTGDCIINTYVFPAESGTVSGAGTVPSGTSVTLTATPAEGYEFQGWDSEGAGETISTANPYTFTATSSDRFGAIFRRIQQGSYTVSIAADPAAGGTVRADAFSGSSGSVARGTSVTATATANAGYRFLYWTDNGSRMGNTNPITVTAVIDHELVAHFERIPTYTVSIAASPSEGGSVSSSAFSGTSASLEEGTNVTVLATPKEGYLFKAWKENGNTVSESANYAFRVNANRQLTAYFEKKPAPTPSDDPSDDPSDNPSDDPTGGESGGSGDTPSDDPAEEDQYPYVDIYDETPTGRVYAFVARMYAFVLNRAPEADGIDFWAQMILNGEVDAATCAKFFILESEEFLNANVNNNVFINRMYKTFFGEWRTRAVDPDGYAFWTLMLEQGHSRKWVLAGFVNSGEFSDICDSYGITRGEIALSDADNELRDEYLYVDMEKVYAYVDRLYNTILGRPAEADGKEFWATMIANHAVTAQRAAVEGFFFSDEYLQKGTSNEEFVNTLYLSLLNRNPADDPDGYQFWLTCLENGMDRMEVIERGFGNSPEFQGILQSYGLLRK